MSLISDYLDCELPIGIKCFPDRQAWEASESWLGGDVRYVAEMALAQHLRDKAVVSGYCWLCGKRTDFTFNAVNAHHVPNWREELSCTGCGLISRTRLGLMLAFGFLEATGTHQPYITEQVTPTYRFAKGRYGQTVGSEYVADSNIRNRLKNYLNSFYREDSTELRHEDVTQLTLAPASVDVVMSFEVLEHVPDYRSALGEFVRVLRPGGLFVLSVPFQPLSDETTVRAVRHADGSVQHLMEPEYHGDPMTDAGCLAFYTFGWDILGALRAAGFERACLIDAWSPSSGIMGGLLGVFLARKAGSTQASP